MEMGITQNRRHELTPKEADTNFIVVGLSFSTASPRQYRLRIASGG